MHGSILRQKQPGRPQSEPSSTQLTLPGGPVHSSRTLLSVGAEAPRSSRFRRSWRCVGDTFRNANQNHDAYSTCTTMGQCVQARSGVLLRCKSQGCHFNLSKVISGCATQLRTDDAGPLQNAKLHRKATVWTFPCLISSIPRERVSGGRAGRDLWRATPT